VTRLATLLAGSLSARHEKFILPKAELEYASIAASEVASLNASS
jgi:hypothetical protein